MNPYLSRAEAVHGSAGANCCSGPSCCLPCTQTSSAASTQSQLPGLFSCHCDCNPQQNSVLHFLNLRRKGVKAGGKRALVFWGSKLLEKYRLSLLCFRSLTPDCSQLPSVTLHPQPHWHHWDPTHPTASMRGKPSVFKAPKPFHFFFSRVCERIPCSQLTLGVSRFGGIPYKNNTAFLSL